MPDYDMQTRIQDFMPGPQNVTVKVPDQAGSNVFVDVQLTKGSNFSVHLNKDEQERTFAVIGVVDARRDARVGMYVGAYSDTMRKLAEELVKAAEMMDAMDVVGAAPSGTVN